MKTVKILSATLAAFAIGISFLLFSNLVAAIIFILYNATGSNLIYWLINPSDQNRLYLFIYPLALAIYGLIFFFLRKRYTVKGDVHWDMKRGIILSIILGTAFGGISTLWVEFLSYSGLSNITFIKRGLEYLKSASGNAAVDSFIITLITVGVLGPVLEEIMFRGIIFTFLERTVNKWYALILSSIIFGAVHMLFVQSVYAGIMGMISGIVYMKTRKLIWSIIIHITINTLASFGLGSNMLWVLFTTLMFIPLGIIMYTLLKDSRTENGQNIALDVDME